MNPFGTFLPELNAHGALVSQEVNYGGEAHTSIEQHTLLLKRIDDALDRGREEGKAIAQTLYETKLEQLNSDFELRIQLAKESFNEIQGVEVAAMVEAAIRKLQTDMDKLLHDAIVPFVENAITSSALVEAAELLKCALLEEEIFEVRVSGPSHMVKTFTEKMSGCGINVIVKAAETAELQIDIDDFSVTTRVNEWLELVREVGKL